MLGGYYINAFNYRSGDFVVDYSKVKDELKKKSYDEVIDDLVKLQNPFPDLGECLKKYNIIDRNGYCMFPYKPSLPNMQIDKNLNMREGGTITNTDVYFLDYIMLLKEILYEYSQNKMDSVKLSIVEGYILDNMDFIKNIIPLNTICQSCKYVVGKFFNGVNDQTSRPNVIKYFYDTGNVLIIMKLLESNNKLQSISDLGKILYKGNVRTNLYKNLEVDIVTSISKISTQLGKIFKTIIDECGDSLGIAANAVMIDIIKDSVDMLKKFRLKSAINSLINNIIIEIDQRKKSLEIYDPISVVKKYLKDKIDPKFLNTKKYPVKNYTNKWDYLAKHISLMLVFDSEPDEKLANYAKNVYLFWTGESDEPLHPYQINDDLNAKAANIIKSNEEIRTILSDPDNKELIINKIAECGVVIIDKDIVFCNGALAILSSIIINKDLNIKIDRVPFDNALMKNINIVGQVDALDGAIKNINSKFELPKNVVITNLICEIIELMYHIQKIYAMTQPSNIGLVIVYCYVSRLAKSNPKYCSGFTNFGIRKDISFDYTRTDFLGTTGVRKFLIDFEEEMSEVIGNPSSKINYKVAQYESVDGVSDCVETAIRNMLIIKLLILGAPIDKLYEKLPPTTMPSIIDFFTKYPNVTDHEISNFELRYDLLLIFNSSIQEEFMKRYPDYSIDDYFHVEKKSKRYVVADTISSPFNVTNILMIILGIEGTISDDESISDAFRKILPDIEHTVIVNGSDMKVKFYGYELDIVKNHALFTSASNNMVIQKLFRTRLVSPKKKILERIMRSIIYYDKMNSDYSSILTNYLASSCYNLFNSKRLDPDTIYDIYPNENEDINILLTSLMISSIPTYENPFIIYLEHVDISHIFNVSKGKIMGANTINKLLMVNSAPEDQDIDAVEYFDEKINITTYVLTNIHPSKIYFYIYLVFIANKNYHNSEEIINYLFTFFIKPEHNKKHVVEFVQIFGPALKKYLDENNITINAFDAYINRNKAYNVWKILYRQVKDMELLHEFFLATLCEDDLMSKIFSNRYTQLEIIDRVKHTLDYKQTEKNYPDSTMQHFIKKLEEKNVSDKIISQLSI